MTGDYQKAVVLLSGGMDSCVAAGIARERHGAQNVALLHAGYGQRTQGRERKARAVYIGAVAEDSSGYPDCRAEYYKVFQELVRVGTRPEARIAIETPVIGMKKSEIIRRGLELGAPLHLTWSCYQDEEEACGACDSCLLRLRAFAEAGGQDPIPYRKAVPAHR